MDQLDTLIDKRAKQGDTERAREELWAESVRRHRERRREENREAWCSYYLAQAERLERTAAELAASHRSKAEALTGEGEGHKL